MPAPEGAKLDHSSTHGDKPKQLDREVRDMVSALTHRLSLLQRSHKSGPSQRENDQDEEDDDDGSIRIITLAGTNTGATMRGDLDEKSIPQGHGGASPDGIGKQDALSTYINSNYQAINNSVMLGGSYSTNDPGVHVAISDDFCDDQQHHQSHKPDKHSKKGKKKDKVKESSKGDHESSEHSD